MSSISWDCEIDRKVDIKSEFLYCSSLLMKLPYYAKRYIEANKSASKSLDWRDEKIDLLLKKWDVVLDIWCAVGGFYDKRKHKKIDFHGVDYNPDLVKFCNEKWLQVKEWDISKGKLDYPDETFDFIYCSHVLEHILSNEQIALFWEMSRVLKKGGKLMLFTPTPYTWYFWDDPTHQRPSTHGSLEHLAKDAGLRVIESKYSNTRFFPQSAQKWLRLPPFRAFLWEVYLVAEKS